MADIVVGVLTITGALFVVLAGVGALRLGDVYARMHAITKASTIAVVLIGAAVAAYFGHKAKVRAIRYGSQTRWAAASRGRVHDRTVPHSR